MLKAYKASGIDKVIEISNMELVREMAKVADYISEQ